MKNNIAFYLICLAMFAVLVAGGVSKVNRGAAKTQVVLITEAEWER